MRTMECPSCGNRITPEFLEYDEYGAGCDVCGYHMCHAQLNSLLNPNGVFDGEGNQIGVVDRCEDAPCCGCCP